MKVLYSSAFVPAEWVAAHGLRPSRIAPSAARVQAEGACPFARAFREAVLADREAAAAIFATTCDQMRRAPEILGRERDIPVFLLNVPDTRELAGYRIYMSELARLGRFLEGIGGRPPAPGSLAEEVASWDGARRELAALRCTVSSRRFAEALAGFLSRGLPEVVAPEEARDARLLGAGPCRVPLAIAGGPLLRSDGKLFDLVERHGGEVVLDASETGERMLPLPADRRSLRQDPFGEMVRIHFEGLPDVFRRPNDALYRWLERELASSGARGIVLRRFPWCDLWHAEAPRLRGRSGLPVLEVDPTGEAGEETFLEGKVASFLEGLR